MNIEENIKSLIEQGQRAEAIRLLEEQLKLQLDEHLLLCLGELIYDEGHMTDALNRFNAVLRLNPENRKAQNYVAIIRNIMGYYCKDLLNP